MTGLTDHDIFRLDIFEGSEYSRQKVEVVLLENSGDYVEGAKAETETYIFIARDGRLEKAEWDYESFRREKMHRWADHSDEYVGEIWLYAVLLWYYMLNSTRSRRS